MRREGVEAIRRGHAPNCSATGSVVGIALVSAAALALVVNSFADRFWSWSDDEDSMVALLAARGAERLPDPPIDLPGGLQDLRQVYARAEALAAEADAD